MRRVVAAAFVGAVVAVGTAGCASVSDSVTPQSSASPAPPNVQNIVYFGTPVADLSTLGNYVTTGTNTSADNKPFIDTVVLFAANINNSTGQKPATPDAQDPVLSFGEFGADGPTPPTTVTSAISTLHSAGVSVLLGILPNHQGVGWSCKSMTSAAQTQLAKGIAAAVASGGFDGISIDDEYSDCITPQPVWQTDSSGPGGYTKVTEGILKALQQQPQFIRDGKPLTITKSVYEDAYMFPKAPTKRSSIGPPLVTQAWTEDYDSDYSELQTYQDAGIPKSSLGLGATAVQATQINSIASTVVQEGYGILMIFGSDSSGGTGYTPEQRSTWYTSALQGEFPASPNAKVVYQPPQ